MRRNDAEHEFHAVHQFIQNITFNNYYYLRNSRDYFQILIAHGFLRYVQLIIAYCSNYNIIVIFY